jgi:polysaccharide biosynthesis/export protein
VSSDSGMRTVTARTPRLGASLGRRLGGLVVFLAVLQIASFAAGEEPREYIVGPNDVLAIMIVDQPELTGKYIVRADGTFTFPLLGRLKAGGLTVQMVENDIRDGLAKGFIKNPQVAVSMELYRSQQIFVMGEVRQPGTLQFTGPMTLIEALARAGSTTDRAGMEVVIVRPPAGASPADAAALQQRVEQSIKQGEQGPKDADLMRIDLETLQEGAVSLNLTLRSGDTVFVPRAESIYVSGQVRTAGEYGMRKDMTVRQALALAGGVTDRGSTRRIQIIRQVNGVDTTIGAELQDAVRPGDTIVVRERLF